MLTGGCKGRGARAELVRTNSKLILDLFLLLSVLLLASSSALVEQVAYKVGERAILVSS